MSTETTTRERPINFTAQEVRGILAGKKTQTRRVVKPQPGPGIDPDRLRACEPMRRGRYAYVGNDNLGPRCEISLRPFAFPGDRLWVREAWCPRSNGTLAMERVQRPFYRADGPDAPRNRLPAGWTWRSPIHMPRWASRLTLEITAVRVERLQQITEADVLAEGLACRKVSTGDTRTGLSAVWGLGGDGDYASTARSAFAEVWDHINGKAFPWASNCWVWVIEFKAVGRLD